MDFFLRPRFSSAILAVMFILGWVRDAQAYLDPGTGSQFLQLFLAGLFGALFSIKIYWRKIKDFFKKPIGGKSKDGNG